jgi:hypothetical protein
MRLIVCSIILNLIGLTLIVGTAAKSIFINSNDLGMIYYGIIIIFFSLLILFFHKNILTDIAGTMVSSYFTVIQKFYVPVLTLVLIQNVIFAFILIMLKNNRFDLSILIGIFLFIGFAFVPFRFMHLKQIKFDKEYFYISNYNNYKKIPLREIDSVKSDLLFSIYKIRYNSQDKKNVCYFMIKTRFFGLMKDESFTDFKSAIYDSKNSILKENVD